MKDRLAQLRTLARPLEPDLRLRQRWMEEINAHAQGFVEALATGPAFRSSQHEGKGVLASPLSEEPEEPDLLLKLLAENIEHTGVNLGAPGLLAFIPISSLYAAALGDYLAAVINPYAGNYFASPGAVRLENLLTRWMAEFVGYPKTCAGDLTSGGSMANLSAVVAAREHRELKAREYEKAVVYLTSQTHHSIAKALRIAGMSGCVTREIPLDSAYRMRPDLLEQATHADQQAGLLPWLVVASAGSTDTGTIDPLNAIADVAQAHRLWLHVDGAYGAMFALCASAREALSGMERSDSLTLDPAKGLFMPCGSGAVLVRNRQDLLSAYHYDAHYLQDRSSLASLDEISPSELSPELTRPFRGLRLWLSLKLIGVRAFRAALEEKLLLARYFFDRVRELDHVEVGPPPDLSVVTFRWLPGTGDPDAYNQRLLNAVQRDGRVFLTSTRLNGHFWIRLAVLCATTHQEHIDLALEILKETSKTM
ncbi:MAG TPA: aminotransferase class V-fold PLP-dependent enzyme [Candidatus Acidoferrum sp.]|jgi:aromatic-L-amino-acid decarboxylase|nr:aminotransferase class V-fold PLP-dependent enzyme [Candidatus Acidoferrum sp.]